MLNTVFGIGQIVVPASAIGAIVYGIWLVVGLQWTLIVLSLLLIGGSFLPSRYGHYRIAMFMALAGSAAGFASMVAGVFA